MVFKHEELKSRIVVMLICGLLFALCHNLFTSHIVPDYPGFVDVMLFSFSVTGMLALQFVGIFSFSQRLNATKENLQVALDYMPGGMMAMDENKDVMLANTRVNELYDLPPDFVKEGIPLSEIVEQILENGGTNEAGEIFTVDGTLDRFSSKELSSVVINTGANRVVWVEPDRGFAA